MPPHPLPPRPPAASPRNPPTAHSPGLSLPRSSPFFSAPQPSSPRPTGFSPYPSGSPKIGGPAGRENAPPIEDPIIWTRKAFSSEELTSNDELIELGEGWRVQWRTWKGPSLLPTRNGEGTTSAVGTPQGATLSSSKSQDEASKKRARPPSAFEEMLAEEEALAAANKAPTASTSTAPLLSERIHALRQLSPQSDPIEAARREVCRQSARLPEQHRPFGLFSSVRVTSAAEDDAKGKGKAKQSEYQFARVLWVFCVTKGTAVSSTKDLASDPKTVLLSLNFPELHELGTGEFTHRDLFPALYPIPPSQTNSSTIVLDPPASAYSSPAKLPASSFPSVLSLTSHLISDTPSTTTNQPRFKGPYEAFLAAASEALVISLVGDPPPASSNERYPIQSRLGDAVVYLPQSSEAFGSSGRRIVAEAVRATFRLSCHRAGLFVQPSVNDVALRPFSTSLPLVDSPVLLAPFGTSARFVKLHTASKAVQAGRDATALHTVWTTLLEGTGLKLAEEESWMTCRVEFPPPKNGDAHGEELDVVWPASLCLLDGSRAQPQRSPGYTPPRAKALELGTSTSAVSSPISAPSPALPLPPLESATRRKLVTSLSRHPFPPSAYRDPVSYRAEQVGSMLEEMVEDRSKRLRAQKDAETTQSIAAPPTPTPTPSASDTKMVTSFSSSMPGVAGAPINMRTPISLGGSSTEAPSPADGFMTMERNLGNFMSSIPQDLPPRNVEIDGLYPSPPEAISNVGIVHSMPRQDEVFSAPPMDNSFNDFDWGTDFGGGMQTNMPQDFEDGMMMDGLTDDDFSFYDEPAPVATLPTSFPGMYDASPKLLDHFPHLTGNTPFPSAASPTSPFSHPSPHHPNASPGMLNFGFDAHTPHMGGNALGLGTPGAALNEGSPFKTPKTPYSAYVDVDDDNVDTPYYRNHSISIAGTPALYSSLSSTSRHGMFEPVPFGHSHILSDDKYDPRKGKFGLPSPVAEGEDSSARRPLGSAPWYTTVCDPRVAAAGDLKKGRRSSLARLLGKGNSANKYAHLVRSRPWIRADLDDDASRHDEDSDTDSMEVEEDNQLGHGDDTLNGDSMSSVAHPFGATLLLLRQQFAALAFEDTRKASIPVTITPAMKSGDAATESGVINLGVQMLYNEDFRGWVKDSLPTSTASSASLVSPQAIQFVAIRLAALAVHLRSSSGPRAPRPLSLQPSPAVLLRAQQSVLQISPAAATFWRPMGFEPLAGAKDVISFAVYEEGSSDLNGAVKAWLGRVAEAYKDSRLGNHAAGTPTSYEDGLVPLSAGALSLPAGREDFKLLCTRIAETSRVASVKHIVIYLLTPPGPLPTSASSPITFTIHQLTKSHFNIANPGASSAGVLVYTLPLSSIGDSRSVAIGSTSINRLGRLAFSVYNQLLIPVQRLTFPVAETFNSIPMMPASGPSKQLFQFPAVTISPARNLKVDFELHWPPSSLEVMHRHRFLQVAYTAVPARGEPGLEWVITSCIDEKGEMWETTPKLVRIAAGASSDLARVKAVWRTVTRIADTVDVEWRIVICHVGPMLRPEIKVWDNVLKEVMASTKRPRHVTLISSDLLPSLAIRHNAITPSPFTPATSAGAPDSEEGEVTGSSEPTRSGKAAFFNPLPSVFAHTPAEPVTTGSASDIIAPASTYLIYLPPTSTLAHADAEAFTASGTVSPAVSMLGIHVLLAYASKSSLFTASLEEHLGDIRQSFVELGTLGQLRWGTNGRLPWHIDAVRQLGLLLCGLQD